MSRGNGRNGVAPGRLQWMLTRFVFRPWWRLSRGLTLGARAIVAQGDEILLVRHSYVPGWHLPGGGVERGETAEQALTRELLEEGNIVLESAPRLYGIYSNHERFRGDHVLLYIADAWHRNGRHKPGLEIEAAEFFSRHDLPSGTTPGTRRRLAEVYEGLPREAHW